MTKEFVKTPPWSFSFPKFETITPVVTNNWFLSVYASEFMLFLLVFVLDHRTVRLLGLATCWNDNDRETS